MKKNIFRETIKRTALTCLTTAAFAVGAQSATVPSLSLMPGGGSIFGGPGGAVGWGFTLTYSDPSSWVVMTGSSFTGSQIYGTYKDYLSLPNASFYVAGPGEGSTVTAPWNSSTNPPLGLGEFDVSSTAPTGAKTAGSLVVHYSVFSQDPNDPNFNPDTATVIADATVAQPAAVTVTPEPGTSLLTTAALLLFAWSRWRRRLARARS